MNKFIIILILSVLGLPGMAQDISFAKCRAHFTNNELTIENNCIKRVYSYNKGHLQTKRIIDLESNTTWEFKNDQPDLTFPGKHAQGDGQLIIEKIENSKKYHQHLRVTVIAQFDSLWFKRIFKLYPDSKAIACDTYIKGQPQNDWTVYNKKGRISTPVFERLSPKGIHWNTKTVEFFDRTDDHNNLVRESKQLVFTKQSRQKGNLFFLESEFSNQALFVLKEAPNSEAQIAFPGCDFVSFQTKDHYLDLQVVGLNIAPDELLPDKWLRCSGFATGVAASDELSKLLALKSYQRKIRVVDTERDEMLMMNTWGDLGQDANINEQFCNNEIEASKKLGLTHFQLDDGWQTGRTANSAEKGGSLNAIWQKQNYWAVDKNRFPNGLEPVIDKARENDIEIGLWFNPSHDNDYANWKSDAAVLINLYNTLGIRIFKIDGVIIGNKTAEMNFRSFLDTLMLSSDNNIMINLDVTGLAPRPGYHYFNEYGNVFLENRYTDWVNYYPHWTLRNLWMLSKYIPAQNLQIEFLNKWRNADKYCPDDVLAPINIPFDYQFVSTLIAQPLAWFEGSKLPEEAFSLSELIGQYKKHMDALHKGHILPIGQEPSGTTWTGFQSVVNQNEGYFLVLKEYNNEPEKLMKTWLHPSAKIKLTKLLGQGKGFDSVVNQKSEILFKLSGQWSYALYKYQIIN